MGHEGYSTLREAIGRFRSALALRRQNRLLIRIARAERELETLEARVGIEQGSRFDASHDLAAWLDHLEFRVKRINDLEANRSANEGLDSAA